MTQITLLISTATGIVVTRGASENNLGSDLTSQLFAHYRVLTTAAVVVALFGLVGGLPKVPFLFLAASFGALARWCEGRKKGRSRKKKRSWNSSAWRKPASRKA